jgi:hypothetical protein
MPRRRGRTGASLRVEEPRPPLLEQGARSETAAPAAGLAGLIIDPSTSTLLCSYSVHDDAPARGDRGIAFGEAVLRNTPAAPRSPLRASRSSRAPVGRARRRTRRCGPARRTSALALLPQGHNDVVEHLHAVAVVHRLARELHPNLPAVAVLVSGGARRRCGRCRPRTTARTRRPARSRW